jgi:hypothetical protein
MAFTVLTDLRSSTDRNTGKFQTKKGPAFIAPGRISAENALRLRSLSTTDRGHGQVSAQGAKHASTPGRFKFKGR